jgi:hypothetical protein
MSQLIVCPHGGFSNRVKNLISASFLDKNYTVLWRPKSFCGLRYSDIFCDEFREIVHISARSSFFNTWRFELPTELNNMLPLGFSDCSEEYKGIGFPGNDLSKTIDFEYLRIPQLILSELLNKFSQLQFKEEIMRLSNTFLHNMPDHYVGVHARTWTDDPDRNSKWFNFDDFVKVCSCFQGQEMFVTSDDPAFIHRLSRALDKELITMKEFGESACKPWHQKQPQEMLDDIVELLILSNASQLILTPMSTYSEVAWYLGGCSKDVYFPDPDFQHKGKRWPRKI